MRENSVESNAFVAKRYGNLCKLDSLEPPTPTEPIDTARLENFKEGVRGDYNTGLHCLEFFYLLLRLLTLSRLI